MDTHVKERLTGAIILVGVLVLLVPELLTGPKHRSEPVHVVSDEAPMRSYTIDLTDAASGSRPGPLAPNETSEDVGSDAVNGAANANEASPTPDPEASGSENGNDGARAQSAPASDAPVADKTPPVAKAEPARPEPKPPQPSAAKPSAAKESTAKAESPPKPAKPPPEPAKTAKPASGPGYSVQLGVFANRANADRLANDVKGKGFSVSVIESRSGGRKLYKVRVGSEPDRASAEALEARLRALKHSGQIVSPP